MPEFNEVRGMVIYIRAKCRGRIIVKIVRIIRENRATTNSLFLEQVSSKLPFVISEVLSRGKEMALYSNPACLAIKVQLRSGGFAAVVPNQFLDSQAVQSHANTILVLDNDTSLVFCECLQLQNQLVLTLEDSKSIWDIRRGPDLLDESDLVISNLKKHLANDFNYFCDTSLFEVLGNQTLFNGLGAYTVSEVLHLLYESSGIVPAIKAYRILDNDAGLQLVVGVITAYLSEMMRFISSHTVDPFCYVERHALDFRQAFVRVYQRHYVVLQCKELNTEGKLVVRESSHPRQVYMYKVPPTPCSKEYLVSRSEKTCYSVADPCEVWKYGFWSSRPTSAGCESKKKLGVGIYSWFSAGGLKQLAFDNYASVRVKDITIDEVILPAPDPLHHKISNLEEVLAIQKTASPTKSLASEPSPPAVIRKKHFDAAIQNNKKTKKRRMAKAALSRLFIDKKVLLLAKQWEGATPVILQDSTSSLLSSVLPPK